MEEKCFNAINNIVLNLSTPTASSTTAANTEKVAETVVKTFVSNDNQNDDIQIHCSMSLAATESVNDESQHQLELEEVFNDETNSGVLETFDQSSTASVTVSDVNSGLESIKSNIFRDDSGDCSSTESVVIEGTASKGDYNESFKINTSSEPYTINGKSLEKTKIINTSQVVTSNELLENQTNSVIISTNVTTIYLETPVVDDQQHHITHHHSQIICKNSDEYLENVAKPKRLSDEFMLVENEIEVADDADTGDDCREDEEEQDGEVVEASLNAISGGETLYCIDTNEFNTMKGKGDQGIEGILVSDLQHDKMSFRLKKMNINNSVHDNNNTASIMDDIPSSSFTTYAQSMADIQSMDLIERRDFENEQRLTGGILLKTSSLINKNKLNLNLIHSCTQRHHQQPQQEVQESQNSQQDNDDACPSRSSNNENSGREVSSDSKCAYKDTSTTPTSSRAYNSRLTKSTAKINLCSSLSHHQQQQQQQQHPQMKQKTIGASVSKLQLSKSSTVIVEAPSTSSTASMASTVTASSEVPAAAAAELYSNSNSNDSLTSERCFPNTSKVTNAATCTDVALNCHQPKQEQTTEEETSETGCSRTNALKTVNNNVEVYDDAQPSTSARCQYAPVSKNMRQVNASAQTNEKYLSRTATCSTSSPGGSNSGGNLSTYRQRRKDPAAHFTRNSTSEEVIAAFKVVVAEAAAAASTSSSSTKERATEYHEDPWADCEENSDIEEICTCQHSTSGSSHGGSNTSLNETEDLEMVIGVKDADLSNYIQMVSISEDGTSHASPDCSTASLLSNQQQRKRKYNEGHLIDTDHSTAVFNSGGDVNSRKRIAYDYASTPRSSQCSNALILSSVGCTTPSSSLTLTASSPISRRTPRSIIPTRDNPPPELQDWLSQFQRWTHAERLLAVDRLIEHCEPTQVRHMMKVIEPQFQRDFISLLPRELALQVLAYLDPMDLLRAAQTCRSWRFLCDDNLLWKEKCRKAQILTEPRSDRPKRGRAGNMPHIASPWKAAYMRQHIIEMNWRSRPIREPKVLKGHDDHVITCLQFSGNRIVSGSDDNTLKVWSAVTGRCLRTLVGHTGGVWSSQMSGNIIISGSTDRTLKVWDMETGLCVHTLLGHTSTVRCMHLHGKRVVSGSRDATLRVWDIELGTCLHVLVGHLAAVRCVQYDGKLIVSGAYDYMVKIWHPERQECLHTLQGHTNRVYSLQFDGIHVVSGSLDTSIRVWDVETGNCKHTLMGHQSLTSGMELRQNILVSGNADSTVKVWDITTGQCLQTLSGPNKHQSAVTCLQFNSRFVVTSSDDGTVKLWDVKTGEFIRNLVALDSGGSGGVVWRIRANDTKLICAVGSRNGTEETKLMVLDFDVEGACVKCS